MFVSGPAVESGCRQKPINCNRWSVPLKRGDIENPANNFEAQYKMRCDNRLDRK
jgi:hypothetical protein